MRRFAAFIAVAFCACSATAAVDADEITALPGFEGELPTTLANLVELRTLYLNGNQFVDLEQTTLRLGAQLPKCEIIT